MFYKFSIKLILWHKKRIFIFQDTYFKYLWVFSRPCDSESTRSVTSKMGHISLLCFPYCRYSKTGITNICWWNAVYGMESLCTYVYYFKLYTPSLIHFQGSPYFLLISPQCGPRYQPWKCLHHEAHWLRVGLWNKTACTLHLLAAWTWGKLLSFSVPHL